MARKKNPEAEEGSDYDDFDYGEEPDFSDPEGFVDDISDEELMPEIMRMRPKETDGVESVIVVDGVCSARLFATRGITAGSGSATTELMGKHDPHMSMRPQSPILR